MSKSGKKQLFDGSESEDEDDSKIKINKNYAQRYDEWREAEIKKKLEDRYGNLDEELSSSSSDDDDDPQELEKAVSKDFFEVISRLRKKDPKIYNPEVRFFKPEEQPSTSKEKKKKEKPIYLRDYERKLIVERGGVLSDDESDAEGPQRPASPSLAEKEKSLKESFQKIVHSDSDNDDGLLTKKVKTAEEKKKEEDDYLEWLQGRKEELNDRSLQESLGHLKEEWSNPNLDDGEKFLRDYVLNKRYIDAEDEDVNTGNLTDEELEEKYMDDFERKFNFRFEEPDSDFLKRYPRTIDSSVRKKDDRRKQHRDEVKKRKEEEKLRQREELKVLKSLKRKEILKKIERIKELTGNAELGISDKDLEGEYDPEEHDRRMNELFNEDYYREGDDEMNLEDLPLPPMEDELLDDYENWDEYAGEEEDLHCEDPNFNMDCDFDPEAARLAKEALPTSSRERRKLKRQSRFGTLVRKKKPEFNPNEKSFQEYVDEYYGIDYEDIVGGQPCRFKYRKVMPNSFGLTIEEILAADDKELNAWVSIKKATALVPDHVELNEKRMYEMKARNEALKRKILPSLYKHEMEDRDDGEEDKPRSKKKKKKSSGGEDASAYKEDGENETDEVVTKKKTVVKDGVSEERSDKRMNKNNKKKSFGGEDASTYKEDGENKTDEIVTKKKTVVEEGVSEERSDKRMNKKKKKSFGGEDASTYKEDGENKTDEIVTKKKTVVEDGDKPKKKGKKRTADAMNESTNNVIQPSPKKKDKKSRSNAVNESTDVTPLASGSNKKQKGNKNSRVVSKQFVIEVADKTRRKKFSVANNQPKSFNKNGRQKNVKNKDEKNRVLQNPISKERKKRQRRGKDRKKKIIQLKYANKAPRDVKAENKERAIRRQNYKSAPVLGDMSDSRLEAYGLNPKKFKNKLVYG